VVRWEDHIRMVLRQKGCGVADWIHVAQDKYQWWALVNMALNLQVP